MTIRWRVFVAIIAPRDEPNASLMSGERPARHAEAMTATYLRLGVLFLLRCLREAADGLAVGSKDEEIYFALFVLSEGHDGT